MNKLYRSILIFNFMVSSLFCVSEAGAVWLLINPGAAAQGTGEAQVARANDAYATYYNPAGLAFMEGDNVALQHVNWLPNLTSDIFYDFISYSKSKNGVGFGGHIIYINLGEQRKTDENGQDLGSFKSFDICMTGSYGAKINSTSAVGFNFKIYHQKLAEDTTVGEAGKPYSTDVAFDISYLKKFGKMSQHSFGLLVQNIGPPVAFIDAEQADPAPTNMKFGISSRIYKDDYNSLHLLFDANKLLVATYTEMDWNGDGIIGNGYTKDQNDDCLDGVYACEGWTAPSSSDLDEYAHSDEWYQSVYTSWLDDWYYGGDFNRGRPSSFLGSGSIDIGYPDRDARIGGYRPALFAFKEQSGSINAPQFPGASQEFGGVEIYVPNYTNFCVLDPADCYTSDGTIITENNYSDLFNEIEWIDLPHDGLHSETTVTENFECSDNNFETQTACEANNEFDADGNPSEDNNSWLGNGTFTTNYGDTDYAPGSYQDNATWQQYSFGADHGGVCDNDFDNNTGFFNGDGTELMCYFDIPYDGEYGFAEDEYGAYNVWGYKEKGSGESRKFSDEFKEMIYNFGLEWWYTDNFVMRFGYIHDDEGEVKQPTFGAGVHFSGYGFDFGYTAGGDTDARSNTMFFSLALNL